MPRTNTKSKSKSKSKSKLSESDWRRVFSIRCASKRGGSLSRDDHALCTRAFHEDGDRYSRMDEDVFNATVPFGSNVRAKR